MTEQTRIKDGEPVEWYDVAEFHRRGTVLTYNPSVDTYDCIVEPECRDGLAGRVYQEVTARRLHRENPDAARVPLSPEPRT